MGERERVKRLVAYCIRHYSTTDPFEIARQMKIQVQFGPLGEYAGCYLFAKNHRKCNKCPHPIKESQGSRTQIHTIYIRRTITAIMQD